MAITVRVQNFQSIEDATVVIDGFTVVTGPNNSGKTALQRAIRGVFTNPPAGALVRHGTAFLSVTITFPDGQTVCWEKGDKVNRYIVNGGKPLEGVGRGVPEVVSNMGVHFIKAGNEKLWPQIAQQFTGQIFLLDRPGSMVAEAVADVEKVGQLSAALKLSEKDRRSALGDLKVRRKDEVSLQKELDGFAGLNGAETEVSALETSISEASDAASSAVLLLNLQSQISSVESEIEQYEGIENVTLPSLDTITQASKQQADLTAFLGLQDKMGRLTRAITVWEKVVDAAKGVTLDADDKAVQQAQKALGFFGKLQDDLADAAANIAALEGQLVTVQENLDTEQVTVDSVLTEMGACPTCHQRTDAPHDHSTA